LKWQLRFLQKSLIGLQPKLLQHWLRVVKRSFFPCKIDYSKTALKQGIRQVNMLKSVGIEPANKDYFELGTGWSPVIPLVFYLAGCKSLILVDDQKLMDHHTFQQTCKQLLKHGNTLAEGLDLASEEVKQKLTMLINNPLDSILSQMNCRYLAPFDVSSSNIPDNSIDIISSRSVLEFINPQMIDIYFTKFHKMLRRDGAMCHIIDNSDHWGHSDKTISILNFLKYSKFVFRLISSINPLVYLNRLRHSEYLDLAIKTGYTIALDESVPDKNALKDLETLKIHPDFKIFSRNDLAILTSYIVTKK